MKYDSRNIRALSTNANILGFIQAIEHERECVIAKDISAVIWLQAGLDWELNSALDLCLDQPTTTTVTFPTMTLQNQILTHILFLNNNKHGLSI